MSRTLRMQHALCSLEVAYEHDDPNKLRTNLQASHPAANLDHAVQYKYQQQDAISPTTECGTSKQKSDAISDLSGSCKRTQSDPYECEPVHEDVKNEEEACTHLNSTKSPNKHTQKRHIKILYLETVEAWKPGNSEIVCPSCGFKGQPVVRRHCVQERKSTLGAICTLGCWPIYFLPFILCPNQIVNLHCCQCKYYLGTYDRKKCRLIQRSSTLGPSAHTSQFYPAPNTQYKHRGYAST